MKHKPVLGLFDVTNLVIGSSIGADIYVVASLGAGLLGPAVLLVWLLGGVMAAIIAQSFAQASVIVPKAGGPYAYAREAFGDFPGFIVGWALTMGEWVSLAVFPIAFVRYLGYFFPDLLWWEIVLIKVAFVGFIVGSNIISTRVGGTVNDALTLAKLAPLLILILAGALAIFVAPARSLDNLTPFAPFGGAGFSLALTQVFWAYAGFELATFPTNEIINPRRTMPIAFFRGMVVVTFFYLLVNLVVVTSLPTPVIAQSNIPLVDSLSAIMQLLGLPLVIGGVLMAIGALFSIAGVNESFALGTARLSYAMAVDGLLPNFFARISPRFGTPYLGILFLGVTALIASLVGNLGGLITVSVFGLSIAYIATGLAAAKLIRRNPQQRLHIPGAMYLPLLGAASALFLLTQTGIVAFIWGSALVLAGLPVYFLLAPRQPLGKLREDLLSPARQLAHVAAMSRLYLAGLLRLVDEHL